MDESTLNSMKVVDLKEELKKHGLSSNGVKAVLVQRLLAFLNRGDNLEDTAEINTSAVEFMPPENVPFIEDSKADISEENQAIVTANDNIEQAHEDIPNGPQIESPPEDSFLSGVGSFEADKIPGVCDNEFQVDSEITGNIEMLTSNNETDHVDLADGSDHAVDQSQDEIPDETESSPMEVEKKDDGSRNRLRSQSRSPSRSRSHSPSNRKEVKRSRSRGRSRSRSSSQSRSSSPRKESPRRGRKRSHSRSRSASIRNSKNRGDVRERSFHSGHRTSDLDSIFIDRAKETPDNWEKRTEVFLDWYNSDMNLIIDASGYKARPISASGFNFMWAGARASYGVSANSIQNSGHRAVAFEVYIAENLEVEDEVNEVGVPHLVRVGWSVDSSDFTLGECPLSWGYGGTGKVSCNGEFTDYGIPFNEKDHVTAIAHFSDNDSVVLSFYVNGKSFGQAYNIDRKQLPEDVAIYPHVLVKNVAIEVNFGQENNTLKCPINNDENEVPEWVFISQVPLENRIRSMEPPSSQSQCEVLMMCGLPGCGKTSWATNYEKEHHDKRFNILGTNLILEKMKVMGLGRKRNYTGRWEKLIEKATNCLNQLIDIASNRRRNFILDQTNVYPNAQNRKMRPFASFRRKAIVIVPTDEEFQKRIAKRSAEEGKDVPESAVLEMKAHFKIPQQGDIFEEVIFPELGLVESEKLVQQYNREGIAAKPPPEKKHRTDSGRRRSPSPKRSNDRYSRDSGDRRYSGSSGRRDYDRHGGGGGGGGRDDGRRGRGGGYYGNNYGRDNDFRPQPLFERGAQNFRRDFRDDRAPRGGSGYYGGGSDRGGGYGGRGRFNDDRRGSFNYDRGNFRGGRGRGGPGGYQDSRRFDDNRFSAPAMNTYDRRGDRPRESNNRFDNRNSYGGNDRYGGGGGGRGNSFRSETNSSRHEPRSDYRSSDTRHRERDSAPNYPSAPPPAAYSSSSSNVPRPRRSRFEDAGPPSANSSAPSVPNNTPQAASGAYGGAPSTHQTPSSHYDQEYSRSTGNTASTYYGEGAAIPYDSTAPPPSISQPPQQSYSGYGNWNQAQQSYDGSQYQQSGYDYNYDDSGHY